MRAFPHAALALGSLAASSARAVYVCPFRQVNHSELHTGLQNAEDSQGYARPKSVLMEKTTCLLHAYWADRYQLVLVRAHLLGGGASLPCRLCWESCMLIPSRQSSSGGSLKPYLVVKGSSGSGEAAFRSCEGLGSTGSKVGQAGTCS